MNDRAFCQDALGLGEVIGELPMDRLNVDGGAIALGHPVSASGARLVLHTLHALKRADAQLGVASLCVGGGQGGALLVEQITEVLR
jgi:acetyl-CoA C-acetyltransferase